MALAHTALETQCPPTPCIPMGAYSVPSSPQNPSSIPCPLFVDPIEPKLLLVTRTPLKMISGCEGVIKQHGLKVWGL